jgi:hypothetical protein
MSLMMMKTNPITPPRELVREWYGSEDCPDGANALANYLCTQAAQWGADQELEACCEWLFQDGYDVTSARLRTTRRPKPPSLKEQALAVADALRALAVRINGADAIRQDVLDIAAELENQ